VQMLEDSFLMKKIRRYGKFRFLSDNIVRTSPRRFEQESARKIFLDRCIGLIKLKLTHGLDGKRLNSVR